MRYESLDRKRSKCENTWESYFDSHKQSHYSVEEPKLFNREWLEPWHNGEGLTCKVNIYKSVREWKQCESRNNVEYLKMMCFLSFIVGTV